MDILVNNLGIFEPKPFEQISDQDWFRFFEVNVLSGVRLSRHYLPRMKERGWGRIIFISSESGIQIPAEMIHYGMTKTAQLAISRGLAETTAGTNVTVNAVLPGPTASEGVEAFVDRMAAQRQTDRAAVEKEFFRSVRPTSLLKRLRDLKKSPRWWRSFRARCLRRPTARRCGSTVASFDRSFEAVTRWIAIRCTPPARNPPATPPLPYPQMAKTASSITAQMPRWGSIQ